MKVSSQSVFIIAFGELDNLGVGYLMSALNDSGIESRMIDFRYDNDEILLNLRRHDPLVVGFSVIYESYFNQFAGLIKYLRNGGISCHFTAGGSYASLHPDELLRVIPELDSVVRFEGEHTFSELVSCLRSKVDWHYIESIAFRENGRIIKTPLRKLEQDLDKFPFPVRRPPGEYAPGRKFATIIAGRGCIYNCSFCSTREFYGTPGGPLKRIRRPEMVVYEMKQLYHENGCSVFLFQDDDFPLRDQGTDDWINSFCRELEQQGLKGKVMWKINCRTDELNSKNLELMKQHGLFLVFIGLEDGTDAGLNRLNKHVSVDDNLRCIELLKSSATGFDYGFMMFQPDTTWQSLSANLEFLRKICSDGYVPVTFLKLLPYFDTQVERELREQGRLTGRPGYFDYEFLSDSINECYAVISRSLGEWMWGSNGVTNLSKWVRNYLSVRDYFCPLNDFDRFLSESFKKTVIESNNDVIDTLDELFYLYNPGNNGKPDEQEIEKICSKVADRHRFYFKTLTGMLNRLKN